MKENIEIPLNKTKILLSLVGALAFVWLGIWLLINPPHSPHPLWGNPTFIFRGGIASILFFGIVAVVLFRKFFDKIPGLIIDSKGITDNASGVSAGFIPWTDIQEIKISEVMNQKFLILIVSNPEDYIAKVTNSLKKSVINMNYKTYGSPISIASNSLQINFDELHALLFKKMKEYKS